MFSISTVWNAWRHIKAEAMVDELRSLGFDRIELSAYLPVQLVQGVADLVTAGRITVTSLHNPCPAPVFSPPRRRSLNRVSLSSRNEQNRLRAVRQALRTLDCAKALGARAVVLHLGEIPPGRSGSKLVKLAARGDVATEPYGRLREKLKKKRGSRKNIYLEKTLKSLTAVVKHAEDLKIKVGVETRYYPWEIPSLEEVGFFLERIKSPHLGYWHDVGHARVKKNMDWEDESEYLKKYGERLIGMHLHDVVGINDHKAPGEGNFEFEKIVEFLKRDVIKVLEIHPGSTAEAIRKALSYLKRLKNK